MRTSSFIGCGCALGAALAVLELAGCAASPIARRETGAFAGNQGNASETVFVGGTAAPDEPQGIESQRRDGYILTHAGEGSDLPGDAWPEEGRDQLDDLRFVYLPRSSRDVVYFGRAPTYVARRWYGW